MEIFIGIEILLAVFILIYSIYVFLGCIGYALLKNLEREIASELDVTYFSIFKAGVLLFITALFLGIYILLRRTAHGIVYIALLFQRAWKEMKEEAREIKRSGWDK